MRKVYLSKLQVKKLASGGEVIISRSGERILLGNKEAAKMDRVRLIRMERIKRLERRLEELRKADSGKGVRCESCECVFRNKRARAMHARIKHKGFKPWVLRKKAVTNA